MSEPVRVPITYCEGCGAPLTGATSTDPDSLSVPIEGDISICAYCRRLGVYRADQTVRRMTTREWDALNEETRAEIKLAEAVLDLLPAPP